MISEYRRGWEDALDVALHYHDWDLLIELKKDLEKYRMETLRIGP